MPKLGKASGVTSSSLRSGMHAGVYFGYMLADWFSIQPELMYSRQGGKVVKGLITRRLDYINLPVMLHYMLPSSMLSGFYLELGLQVGFVVNTQLKGPDGKKLSDDQVKTVKDVTNKFDFALAGGLGYHFNRNWNANVRYAQGLNSTLKDTGNGKQRNSVVQLSVGYTF